MRKRVLVITLTSMLFLAASLPHCHTRVRCINLERIASFLPPRKLRLTRQSVYFRRGGKSLSNFCIALSMFLWFFCGSLLGLMVFVACPVQTSCFAAGSNKSRIRVPTSMLELVGVAELIAVDIPGERKMSPMPVAFHCLSLATATW